MTLQIKLDLKNKSDLELKQFTLDHQAKAKDSTAFPSPWPDAQTFQAAYDGFDGALGDADQAQKTAREKILIKDTARAALELALTQRAHYLESVPGVTADKVLGVGFGVRGAGAPTAAPDKVTNLSLTTGDNNGEVDAHWDRTDHVRSYEVQTSPDPFTDASWQTANTVTKSKTVLTGLKSGTKIWVRVRAIGAGGRGAWSDPVALTVP